MKKYIIYSLVVLTIFSCTEINDVVNPGEKPIIEAYLAPGQIVSMKVFTEIPYSATDSTYSKPIDELLINIKGSNGQSFTLINKGDGLYQSTEKIGKTGDSYDMNFTYMGRTISATTILPPKPTGASLSVYEISRIKRDLSAGLGQPGQGGGPGGNGAFQQEDRTPIQVTWTNSETVYHFVAAQLLETTLDPVITFPSNENGFTRPPRRFNNQPVLSTTSNLQPQQFEYFGKYAIIIFRLNGDYAALYENNNTSTQNIATPVSTITNGLGIFTGVNADTLILNVTKMI